MELIQLNISALRQSDSQNNAYVLLLNETIGERQLPIVVGWCEARAIAVALDNKEKPERPLTHDLFKDIGDKFSILVSKIVIHKLNEGVFHSTLYFKNSITKEIEIDSRTSDAIAIAIRFSCPIFTYEDILSRASILTVSSYGKESGKSNIIEKEKKINRYTLEELEDSLKQAIKVENYEKASLLRDEIKRRTS